MSDLETENRDVLGALVNDLSISLHREDKALLSAWVMKTVMASESLSPKAAWFYTEEERAALKDARQIPHGTWIWAGRYFESNVTDSESRELHGKNRKGCLSTLVAGRVVMQALTLRRPEVPLRTQPGPWHRLLREVWPGTASISWPPSESLREREMEALSRRFLARR